MDLFDFILEQNSLDAFPMDNENDCCWKGNTMEEIYRSINEWELSHFPPIINRRDHIVLFELPINLNSTEPPKPHKGHSKWDSNHVRMPCSSQNEYLVSDEVNFKFADTNHCLVHQFYLFLFIWPRVIPAQRLKLNGGKSYKMHSYNQFYLATIWKRQF